MKYKLLKDTPTHKAGTVLVLHKNSCGNVYISRDIEHHSVIIRKRDNDYIEYKEVFVENNPEWFEKVEERLVAGNGMVKELGKASVGGIGFDSALQSTAFNRKLQSLKAIWMWHAENDDIVSEYAYCIYYSTLNKEYDLDTCLYYKSDSFMPTFKSKETADKCIEECKEHLDILFDVKS